MNTSQNIASGVPGLQINLSLYPTLIASFMTLLAIGFLYALMQGYKKDKLFGLKSGVTLYHTLCYHYKFTAIVVVIVLFFFYVFSSLSPWLYVFYPPIALISVYLIEKSRAPDIFGFPMRHGGRK